MIMIFLFKILCEESIAYLDFLVLKALGNEPQIQKILEKKHIRNSIKRNCREDFEKL